eukprot:4953376-Karenia_brevis.AAC.1
MTPGGQEVAAHLLDVILLRGEVPRAQLSPPRLPLVRGGRRALHGFALHLLMAVRDPIREEPAHALVGVEPGVALVHREDQWTRAGERLLYALRMDEAGAQAVAARVLEDHFSGGSPLPPGVRAVDGQLALVQLVHHLVEASPQHLRDLARHTEFVVSVLEGRGAEGLREEQAAQTRTSA